MKHTLVGVGHFAWLVVLTGTPYDVSLDGRSIYFEHQTDQKPPREFGVVLARGSLMTATAARIR